MIKSTESSLDALSAIKTSPSLLLFIKVGKNFSSHFLPFQLRTTIAIFDFENNGLEPHEVRQLTKRLESELVKLKDYNVVERSRIDEVLKEQKIQASGCTETCLLDVGKILGATQIVYGSIGKIGDLYTISAKLVDAETGKLIRSSDYDADYGLTQLLKYGLMIVANRLRGNLIEDNYVQGKLYKLFKIIDSL